MEHHGNKVHWDNILKKYRMSETNEIIDDLRKVKCAHCHQYPTPEGHDHCLGTLKNVDFACCGHGGKVHKYVKQSDGKCFHEDEVNFNLYK